MLNATMRPSIHIDVLLTALAHAAQMPLEICCGDEDAGAVWAFEKVLWNRIAVVLSQTVAHLQWILIEIFFPSNSASRQSASVTSATSRCRLTFLVRTNSAISIR